VVSPYAGQRWVLITSLDDFSRKILYADFFEQETTWAHIKAAETVMLNYGIPIKKLTTIEEVRAVLKEEVDRYNNHQVHSTTGEVPNIRFEKARKEGKSLFRPFALPKPYTSTTDVFCLRETRMVNGYRKISLFNHEIVVPNVPLREHVEVHMIPDLQREAFEVRIWWDNRLVQSLTYPLKEFPRVQF
jgi:hypothetical protein